MLKRFLSKSIILSILAYGLSACTGGATSSVSPSSGGFRITPGERISIDLSDVVALGVSSDLSVTLKQPTDNYQTASTLLDLTNDIVQNATVNGQYSLILPKNIANIRPMILLVESPSLQAQFIDVLYDDTSSLKPGIASTLTYNLMKYYPGKTFSSFTSSDFNGIKQVISAKIAEVQSQTEQLSLSSVRFDRVMRFYKNTMAFNPVFLNAVNPFGIQYTFNPNTVPAGLVAADTPEGSLDNYYYASQFEVNGQPAPSNPFNEINNPSRLGSATPGIGTNIAMEGSQISLSASATDPDDDFIDKSFIIEYTPRKLPENLPSGVDINNLPKPEPLPEYVVKPASGRSDDPATYTSATIQYNEAINKQNYKKGIGANTPCDINDTDTDVNGYPVCGETGIRDIYMLVTDGMIQMPYHWQFKYADVNRAPHIIADAAGRINDTSLDDQSINFDFNVDGTTHTYGHTALASETDPNSFREHASHCETDFNDNTQSITTKADGPWSCVFKSYDQDLDDDPNAAVDDYYYSLANYEPSTEIHTNSVLVSPLAAPPLVNGAILSTCTDSSGVAHRKCGVAQYAITVDNSVKVASASKASLQFSYDVMVSDRPAGGLSVSKTVARKVQFKPIPPRLVNFDARTKPGTILAAANDPYPSCEDVGADPATCETYQRNDMYIDELLGYAGLPPTADPQAIGFRNDFFTDTSGTDYRLNKFHFTTNGTSTQNPDGSWMMSSYFTQPHRVSGDLPTIDTTDGSVTNVSTIIPRLYGNLVTGFFPTTWPATFPPAMRTLKTLDGTHWVTNGSDTSAGHNDISGSVISSSGDTYDADTYSYPREYDLACQMDSNNVGFTYDGSGNITDVAWDQRPIRGTTTSEIQSGWDGGWTFEINAVDLDNVDLRASEPYEPIYLALTNDATIPGMSGLLQFCAYQDPNPDTYTYTTYNETTSPTGVHYPPIDPDYCIWKNVPPSKMQAVQVFYQKPDNSYHKMVYHRLRVRWKPIDHKDIASGHVTQPTKDLIMNYLTSLMIYGDRYENDSNKGDLEARQDMSSFNDLEMVAARKNQDSCVNYANTVTPSLRYFVLNDANPSASDLTFNVKDANRFGEGGNSSATAGRYEAEIYSSTINGAHLSSIDQVEFSRFVPFVMNCTSSDGLPVSTQPPLVWYAGDNDLTPRARITASSTSSPVTDFPFCIHYGYQAYQDLSGRTFDNVALFYSTGTATLAKNAIVDSGGLPCFTQDIHFTTTETYALVATPCKNISYSSGAVSSMTEFDFNPTETANGAFPSGTLLRMKLFPAFYGATYDSNSNNLNMLAMNISGVDSFVYDLTSGLSKALDLNDSSARINTVLAASPYTENRAPASQPMLGAGVNASTLYGYVDWDHQPTAINLADATPTPTPAPTDNVFYRIYSGNLKVYVKGTSTATIPIKITNTITGTGIPTSGIEQDPFDVIQFKDLKTTDTAPGNLPVLATRLDGSACDSTPGTYPSNLATLTYDDLNQYRNCKMTWTPASGDVGKIFNYTVSVQDNAFATADPNTNLLNSALGAGAVFPKGLATTPFSISNASSTSLNGPYSTFNISLESIEANLPVKFYADSTHSNPISSGSYCTSVDSSLDCSSSTPAAVWANSSGNGKSVLGDGFDLAHPENWTCMTDPDSGFSCPNNVAGQTIQQGDVLANEVINGYVVPEVLQESQTAVSISVDAFDDNTTTKLKTISAAPIHKVLVIDKSAPGVKLYTVPSLTSATVSAQTDGSNKKFTLSWAPTDLEAYELSNADGFLIPFVISDQDYCPATDSDFPKNAFCVSHITRTIWVYAKMQVQNNAPVAYYLNDSGTEVQLSGAILSYETGQDKTYKIRIHDTDRARAVNENDYTTFTATSTAQAAFMASPSSSGTLQTPSGQNYVYQEYTIGDSVAPTISDIGMSSYSISIADPGDLTKCYSTATGVYDASYAPVSCEPVGGDGYRRATLANQPVSFNIQVTGKPFFLVPPESMTQTDQNTVDVYAGTLSNPTPLNYPLSLSISRTSEIGKPFFFGLMANDPANINAPIRTTVTPSSTPIPSTSTGLYVNTNGSTTAPIYTLKWPDVPYSMSGQTSVVEIYGIAKSNCKTSKSTGDYTLIQYNDSTNQMGTNCYVSSSVFNDNAAKTTLYLNIHAAADLPPLPTLSRASVTRSTTTAETVLTDAQKEADRQYQAFVGRCDQCTGTPTHDSGASPTTAPVSLGVVGSSSSADVLFSANNYDSEFSFAYDGSAALSIDQSYTDTLPSATRSISLPALKGDTLHFKGAVSSVPSASILSYYRWYVNGCLKKAGQINVASPSDFSYDLPISLLMSGLNNDCTGEYSITETDGGRLGALQVRLNIVNNIEAATTTTDNAPESYIWNVNVLNNQPNVQAGLAITANGNADITLAMPVSFNSKSYLAYIDPHTSSGAAIRAHEIKSDGTLNTTALIAARPATVKTPPVSFGMDVLGSTYKYAINNATTYPNGSNNATLYNNKAVEFYSSSSTDWMSAMAYSSVANNISSTLPIASFNAHFNTSTNYSQRNDQFYFFEGQAGYGYRALRQFWVAGKNMTAATSSLYYGQTPSNPFDGNSSLAVRKNIVIDKGTSSGTLIQLVGSKNSGSGTGGTIKIVSFTAVSTHDYLTSTSVNTIRLSDSTDICGSSAIQGGLSGTYGPIDALYDAPIDTLFVLAYQVGGDGTGRLLAISDPTGTPSCQIVQPADPSASIANPSMDASSFNPNVVKLALDSTNQFIYGVLAQGGGNAPQLYFIDALAKKVYLQNIASSINPTALIYSKEQNAVLILDGDHTGGKVPKLYKVW